MTEPWPIATKNYKNIYGRAAIGLRAVHFQEFLESSNKPKWVEIHSENFFCGGRNLRYLEKIRAECEISLHCVAISLGSFAKPSLDHLEKLKQLIDIIDPVLISDHISWSIAEGAYLNDLIPASYTKEALQTFIDNIDFTQNNLGRQILVENPSSYLQYKQQDFSEVEFMNLVAKQSGAGILLDVNNIYVSSQNHGFNAIEYINNIAAELVYELHIAGHTQHKIDNSTILIDTHNQHICSQVWDLYKYTISKFGAIPTLFEWDSELPPLSEFLFETKQLQDILERASEYA